jgi:hypothetical protein
MKTPLVLPYERKDEFKQKYGKNLWWNAKEKAWTWVGDRDVPEDLKRFVARTFYMPPANGPRLTIELIPETCWFSNIRNHVSHEGWKFISKQVFAGAHYRCQICGGQGDQWPVECHEIFEFDDRTHTQKLVGLVALCPACHNAKHFGLAQMKGQEQAALDQLEKVNRWTQDEFDLYIDEVFSDWRRRSEHKWNIDLSFLKENFGIEVKGESAQNRAVRRVAAYEVIKQHGETSSEFLKNEEIFISDSKEAGVKASVAEPVQVPAEAGKKGFLNMLKGLFRRGH